MYVTHLVKCTSCFFNLTSYFSSVILVLFQGAAQVCLGYCESYMVSRKLSVVDDVFADYSYVCILPVYLYTISAAFSFYTAHKSIRTVLLEYFTYYFSVYYNSIFYIVQCLFKEMFWVHVKWAVEWATVYVQSWHTPLLMSNSPNVSFSTQTIAFCCKYSFDIISVSLSLCSLNQDLYRE